MPSFEMVEPCAGNEMLTDLALAYAKLGAAGHGHGRQHNSKRRRVREPTATAACACRSDGGRGVPKHASQPVRLSGAAANQDRYAHCGATRRDANPMAQRLSPPRHGWLAAHARTVRARHHANAQQKLKVTWWSGGQCGERAAGFAVPDAVKYQRWRPRVIFLDVVNLPQVHYYGRARVAAIKHAQVGSIAPLHNKGRKGTRTRCPKGWWRPGGRCTARQNRGFRISLLWR